MFKPHPTTSKMILFRHAESIKVTSMVKYGCTWTSSTDFSKTQFWMDVLTLEYQAMLYNVESVLKPIISMQNCGKDSHHF